MGYCITLEKAEFKIKKDNLDAALKALKELGNGSNHPEARGGSWSGGKQTHKHFSWMNDYNPDDWHHITDVMEAWGYPVTIDKEGDVSDIDFDGEKIGQEEIMFTALAPFVEDKSYIQMRGEDGAKWRWVFSEGKFSQKDAKVSF